MIKSLIVRWVKYIARIREKSKAYRILGGKPEGKRPLGRSRRRLGLMLKWILEWGGMDWTVLAQDRDEWRLL
jgi:hypothetical protein